MIITACLICTTIICLFQIIVVHISARHEHQCTEISWSKQTLISLCECSEHGWKERNSTSVNLCTHLPVEDNAPDEAQGQLMVPIYNISPSYVYQINLKI